MSEEYDPSKFGARCSECYLRTKRLGPPVPSELNPGAKVLVVGEAPGETEVEEGRPFCGPAGSEMMKGFTGAGAARNMLAFDNAVACRPAGNDMRRLLHDLDKVNKKRVAEGKSALPTPAECCRPRFLNVLRRYHNVVTLGQHGLAATVNDTEVSVMKLRGGPLRGVVTPQGTFEQDILFHSDGHLIDVMPTLHPAFVLRAQRWRRPFRADIAKAWRLFNGVLTWAEPVIQYNPSLRQVQEFLGRDVPFYAADYETDGLEPLTVNVRCLGIGNEKEVIIVGALSIDGQTRFYDRVDEEAINHELALYFAAKDRLKVGHNFNSYDRLVMRQHLNVDPKPVADTLPYHKSVESELPHTLGFVGSIYTDVGAWKAKNTAKHARSDAELFGYCGVDCATTALVFPQLQKAVEVRGQTAIAILDHKLQYMGADMHETGLYVDEAARVQHDAKLRAQAIFYRTKLRDALGGDGPSHNPNSFKQVGEVLFDRWKLPVQEYTDLGEPSTGDDSIRALLVAKDTPKHAREYLYNLRMFRKRVKARGTYVRKLVPNTVVIAEDELSEDEDWEEAWRRAKAEKDQRTKHRLAKERRGIVLSDGRIHANWGITPVAGRYASSDPNCFDAATEALTRRGWVRFPELRADDAVAQWWEDGRVNFVRPTARQVVQHTGEMVTVRNQHIDLRVTGDHRCLLQHRRTGEFRVFVGARYPEDWKQLHGGRTAALGLPHSDDVLRLACAVQADGSLRESDGIEFAFQKRRKIKRLREMLQRLGCLFTERVDSILSPWSGRREERTRFYVPRHTATLAVRSLLGTAKTFGSWVLDLSYAQAKVVAEEVHHWDGCAERQSMYSSSVEANVDWVQAVMALAGLRAKKRVYKAASGRDNFQLDVTQRDYSLTTNVEKTVEHVVGETVYCVSVPSSYVIVRRNGRVCVTGQCQNFPRRLRDLIRAAPGNILVAADMDQIELRFAAALAGAKNYLRAFAAPKSAPLRIRDPHTMAALMMQGPKGEALLAKAVAARGEKDAKNDPDWSRLRDFAKRFQYAKLYGALIPTVHDTLTSSENDNEELIYADLELRETRRASDAWEAANPEFVRWWDDEVMLYRRNSYLRDPVVGRQRDFLDGEDRNEILNFRCQAGAAGVVTLAQIELCLGADAPLRRGRWGPGTGLIQHGHDALVFEVPEARGKEVAGMVVEAMTRRIPGLDVLFTAEAKVGYTWNKV